MSDIADCLVPDANLVVKLVNEREAFADRARAILRRCLRREARLTGPPFLLVATNAVYQQLRRKELTEAEADMAATQLQRLPIRLLALEGLTLRSYRFVRQHRLANVYDSRYVVLAEMLGAEFWTGKQRMVNAFNTVAPWVRWIGDYPVGDGDA